MRHRHDRPGQLLQRQRASAHLALAAHDLARRAGHARGELRRQPVGALVEFVVGGAEHRQHGQLVARPGGIGVQRQRRLEGRQRQLVGTQRARQRVLADARQASAIADHEPGLRAAQQLVARAGEHVHAGLQAVAHRGLAFEPECREVGERAAAEVLDQRHARLVGQLRQLGQLGLRDEPLHAEVAAMHAQDRAHVLAVLVQRLGVVLQIRAIGGAHLHQRRARELHDLGHAERAADLHQLAARDDDLLARGDPGQRQQDRGGAVVDRQRRLGARQARDPALDADAAVAALALLQVVLQRAIAGRHVGHRAAGELGERRPAEVRVQHDAGGVQHPAQQRARYQPRARGRGVRERVQVGRPAIARALQGRSCLGDRLACGVQQDVARQLGDERGEHGVAEQAVDRGERAKRVLGHAREASRGAD